MRVLKIWMFLLILFLVIIISCKKDLTNEIDITSHEWRVQFIKDGNKKTRVPNKDYHGNSISNTDYVLSFTNDSVCSMPFSINQGEGRYHIESLGEIKIAIGSMTKICCDCDFDIELSLVFSKMMKYKVINNTLIFEGDKGSIQLKKE